jgi:hypothetical protein
LLKLIISLVKNHARALAVLIIEQGSSIDNLLIICRFSLIKSMKTQVCVMELSS